MHCFYLAFFSRSVPFTPCAVPPVFFLLNWQLTPGWSYDLFNEVFILFAVSALHCVALEIPPCLLVFSEYAKWCCVMCILTNCRLLLSTNDSWIMLCCNHCGCTFKSSPHTIFRANKLDHWSFTQGSIYKQHFCSVGLSSQMLIFL